MSIKINEKDHFLQVTAQESSRKVKFYCTIKPLPYGHSV